jgi:hypothetical protein
MVRRGGAGHRRERSGEQRGRAGPVTPGGPQPRFHQEHERFYASSPLESALRLAAARRALLALADRWATAERSPHRAVSPFEGAEDLNSEAARALTACFSWRARAARLKSRR